ncbi:sulfatase [Bacteroidota bacterium]
MNQKNLIRKIGLGAAAAGMLLPACQKDKDADRPNIIYIMSDDHAFQAISAYGSNRNNTPNIDKLASQGMIFNNSFCTNSISAPCRAVVLTGKYSHINGHIDNARSFDGTQTTFPKLLQKAGYQTAIIGKWHLQSTPTGFDYWNILPGQGDYYNPVMIEKEGRKKHTGYVTNIITDFAIEWLDKRNEDKPFCLMIHNKAPHRNWLPEEKYLHLFDDVDMPLPETFYDDYSTRSLAAHDQEMTIDRHMYDSWDLKIFPEDTVNLKGIDRSYYNKLNQMTAEQRKAWDDAYEPKNKAFKEANLEGDDLLRWKYQRYIKDYLRCIQSVDDNVGRVMKYLEENGLAENTIIVYTSDQGFYLGEHGWFDKRFMYEESLRMPLIVRYPKEIPAGSVSNDIVLNLDFAATFLDYANFEIPDSIQGRSMRPVLKAKTPKNWRNSMYYHYYEYPQPHKVRRHYGLRTQKYKLIHFYDDIDAWELFDMDKDPNELNNVIDNPDYNDVVKKLKAELIKQREIVGDSDQLTKKLLKKN